MSTPMSAVGGAREHQAWRDVDDYLGPARDRFFGSGYRGTSPRLLDTTIQHHSDRSTLLATGSLAVAGAWSVKDGTVQRPHLATTDVLAFAAQAAGALLTTRFDRTRADDALVTAVDIRASTAPLEDLDAFPVEATLEPASAEETSDTTMSLSATVGPLRATGTITCPVTTPDAAPAGGTAVSDILSDTAGSTYTTRLVSRILRLRDVRMHDGAIAASLQVSDEPPVTQPVGIEAGHQPAYSLVDVFVAALQLGQVLLYELDGLDRGSSSTLWMRRTTIRTDRPLPVGSPVPARVALERGRLVERDGEPWRLADIVAEIGPYRVVCSVAHQI
ncbi:AvrD family protein [Promicromonospora sp. CA-289599]|uniref:AvrD family protein n=1 Tax=Promicromonospora sp. CA-289599 TaxID=3240014 RepID=UPI003D8D9DC2